MADDEDKTLLPKAAREKIIEKIQEKAGTHQHICSVCGTGHWGVEPRLFAPWPLELLKDGGTRLPLSFVTYPLTMIVCKNCGHTVYLNIKVLGLGNISDLLALAEEEENVGD